MSCKPDLSNPLTGPFWQAARERRLALPHCQHCMRLVWYPEACCPTCHGGLEWRTVSGRATVAAFTVVHRPLFAAAQAWTPYVPALVALEEDPAIRLVTQLVDCDPARVRCDMPVAAVFRDLPLPDGESYAAPLFKPAPALTGTHTGANDH